MALEALSAWQLSRGLAPSHRAPGLPAAREELSCNQIAHYQKQKLNSRLRVYCCDHRQTTNVRPGCGKVSGDLLRGEMSRTQGL